MSTFLEQKKRLSVQQVYWFLRKTYGGKTAEAILDSLEGHAKEYESLVDMIEAGEISSDIKLI